MDGVSLTATWQWVWHGQGQSDSHLAMGVAWGGVSHLFSPQEGALDYSTEIQQLEREGEMPLEDLLSSLPAELLEGEEGRKEEEEEEVGEGEGEEAMSIEHQAPRRRYVHVCVCVC